MNWLKENPFLSGLLLVALGVAAVLSYLIFQSWSSYSAASEAYTNAVTTLHRLQNKVPFPNEQNLSALKTNLDHYATRVNALQSQLAGIEMPLDSQITSQQFQDELRAAVDNIQEKASRNGVKLPEKFYFGFDQYQSQLPPQRAAPYLNRQLLSIQAVVLRLVDFKVRSIDDLKRLPLPQEDVSGAPSPAPGEANSQPILARSSFQIAFTAEQSKLRVALDSLLGSDQFLIIRTLMIENTSPQAPPRKLADEEPSSRAIVPSQSADVDLHNGNLQVILGRELVKATLRLEMLDFDDPPSAKHKVHGLDKA